MNEMVKKYKVKVQKSGKKRSLTAERKRKLEEIELARSRKSLTESPKSAKKKAEKKAKTKSTSGETKPRGKNASDFAVLGKAQSDWNGVQKPTTRFNRFCRSFIEYGIYGVLIFSPLPAASVYEWSVLVIVLAVFAMTAAYLVMPYKALMNGVMGKALRWPQRLFSLLFVFLIIQIVPWPKFLVRILSPGTYRFYQSFDPGFQTGGFLSLSLVPFDTLKMSLEILAYILLGWLVLRTVRTRRQINRILGVIVGMGLFQAFYGFFELYSKNPSILFYKKIYYQGYVTGTFVNRNHLAGYLEMTIPLMLGLILARSGFFSLSGLRWKDKLLKLSEKGIYSNLLLALGVTFMALAIIFSQSRSGISLVVISFLLFIELGVLYFKRGVERKRAMQRFLGVVFMGITVLAMFAGIDATLQRFSMDKILASERPVFWSNSLEIVSDYPVMGSGLGTFASIYPAYEKNGIKGHRLEHAHNDCLEYLSELGVVGMALLLGGILMMLIPAFLIWRVRNRPFVKGVGLGGVVAVLAILIHGITDFNLHIPANMVLFSVVLSLTVVVCFYKASEKVREGKRETKS